MFWADVIHATIRELHHGGRRLLRSSSFTMTVVLTLGLAIGSTVAIFSVVKGVLLDPLPYPEGGRLVSVSHAAPGIGVDDLGSGPFLYFTERDENRTLEGVGAWSMGTATVTGASEPEQIRRLLVTADVLPLLRVQPAIGRQFSIEDDIPDANPTVLLSYGYWQRRFGGDRSIVGRSITMDGQPRSVIGVMPEGFRFLDQSVDAIYPYRLNQTLAAVGAYSLRSIARLAPGVTLEQANADVERMIPLAIDRFALRQGVSREQIERSRLQANVKPLKNDVVGNVGATLWLLLACIGMVLLIACANVANLLLVRVEARQRDLAIRAALGSGWSAVGRELLSESALLSLGGGALGIALSFTALRALQAMAPPYLPRIEDVAIDSTLALFALPLMVLTTLLCACMPMLRLRTPDIAQLLQVGGRTATARGWHSKRNGLIVAQVALAMALLVGAGLMVRTADELDEVDPGFGDAEHLQTFRIDIPRLTEPDTESAIRMQHAIADRIEAVAGVLSAAYISALPLDSNIVRDGLFVEGRTYSDAEPLLRHFKFISPRLFATLGTPLLAGRDITWTDVYEKRPVVIISQSLAVAEWGTPEAAVGKRIRSMPTTDQWREVVGVTGNIRDRGPTEPDPGIVYVPILAERLFNNELLGSRAVTFVIQSSRAGTATLLEEIRAAVWSVDSNLPLSNVRTLGEIWGGSLARTSFTRVLLVIAGIAALLLGLVGIYGMIAYSVTLQSRDIAVRIAVGAPAAAISSRFVIQALALALLGIAIGFGGAAMLARWMGSLLFGVDPMDAATYIAAASVLAIAAIVASYLPARRAAMIDPVRVLRAE
jgi:predicted permease